MSRSERRPGAWPSRRSAEFGTARLTDLAGQRCFPLLRIPRQVGARRAHDLRIGLAHMDEHHVGRGDDAGIELEARQAADMHARLQPLSGEHRLRAVGRAHHDVGSRHGFARRCDSIDSRCRASPASRARTPGAVRDAGCSSESARCLRTAQIAIACAPACQPAPSRATSRASGRARNFAASPLVAPTRMRCTTPSG